MHVIDVLKSGPREQSGFAMASVIMAVAFTSLMAVAAVAAVNGDINVTSRDLDNKRAYEAAQAGLADYSFHLNNDNGYWARCTNVPMPNAVNQEGLTDKRRPVPGGTGAEYALELLPRSDRVDRTCSTADPVGSMIEGSGPATGTFRIRSTGYSGDVDRSIVATYKRASFLDYVYFTQFETSDPETYPTESWRSWARTNCAQTRLAGRPMQTAVSPYCTEISFINNEEINGPLHTNDSLSTSGSPIFGRSESDLIEVSAPPFGCFQTGTSNPCSATFNGQFLRNAPVLTPPPTNLQLRNVPGALKFTGQVVIELTGSSLTVTNNTGTLYSGAMPSSGVIYVSNGSCGTGYSPFTVGNPEPPATSGCGNALVKGNYTVPLTIGAENDIVVTGNVERASDEGLLGLIANNFVRVNHPVDRALTSNSCNGAVNLPGATVPTRIDAAILAIQHSFIVDHYNCGSPVGTLTVNGAISQKFRGPVGTFNSGGPVSGYVKNYNYDDRLRYLAPPHFLDPVESAWRMQRQTLMP